MSLGVPNRDDHQSQVDQVRLRLVNAASDLRPSAKPLDGPRELRDRLAAVMRDVQQIQKDLLLLFHCTQLEESGLSEKIEEIEAKLADGWKPGGSPVEDVVKRLEAARTRL
jgi:hypothetical protein